MKGDGEDKDFLSLGRRSWEREARKEESLELNLSMLAGGGVHGGFTLKPPPVPSFGGGVSGSYYRPKRTWPAGMGMLFVNEEASSSHSVVAKLEQPLGADVESLTPEECWSVVLKLGKRWPAWNRTMALHSPQGVRSALHYAGTLDPEHHSRRVSGNSEVLLGQDSLKLLTTRALEALAQAPAGSMHAPKQTTQQFSKGKAAARDLPSQAAAAAKPPTNSSSRVMAAAPSTEPRTAPLTIFYDGKVNVSNYVPEDKAHLIMLFAERSSIPPNTQAPAVPSASCPAAAAAAAPSTSASPQVTPQPHPVVAPSHHQLAPGKNHSEGSSSHHTPPESSNPPAQVAVANAPAPTSEANTSRQLMQQCLNGPMSKRLPNARKNSLARFLDSRKRDRPNASGCEDPSAKKQELEPAEDTLCSSSSRPSFDSKEGVVISAMCSSTNDAEMTPHDSLTK